ncbi:MAG: TolC family protein [Desulfuromonadales bacterium]
MNRLRFLLPILLLNLMAAPACADAAKDDQAPLLTLRETLRLGVQRNLDLQITAEEIPISAEDVSAEEAAFDPVTEISAETGAERTPTTSVFTGDQYDRQRRYVGSAGLNKRFRTGTEGSVAFETSRRTTNSAITGLDPEYRSYLILDLTQPLLRDFGDEVNTASLREARERRRQASLQFLDRARLLAGEIEQAYTEVGRSRRVVERRLESRELARELLDGNREKFESGLIPVSEVQEAQTAVAARDEELLLARQQAETALNNLEDLLESDGRYHLGEAFRTESLSVGQRDVPRQEEAFGLALDNRPDLESRRIELSVRDIRLTFARNQKLPRLDLQGTLGTNGLSGNARTPSFGETSGPNPFRGDYNDSLEGMAERDGYEWAVGLNFSYPLDNRRAESRYRQAILRKRQEVHRLHRLENRLATEVENALVAVNRSLERVEVAERVVSLAETTLQQEMDRLAAGLSNTFRILDFQEDLIAAQVRLINARADVEKGMAELYAAMGLNLERHGIRPELARR